MVSEFTVSSRAAQSPGYLLADVKNNRGRISTLFPRFGVAQALQDFQNQLETARNEAQRLGGVQQDAFTRQQDANNQLQTARTNYEQARQRYTDLQQQGQNGSYT